MSLNKTVVTVVLVLGVMLFGTLNNFLGRMKASGELLGSYNFVTVVPDTCLHLLINAGVTAALIQAGQITRGQLEYVFRCGRRWKEIGIWKLIMIAAVNDVANNVTGLASQPYLTALMMSLMDQATTPFTVVCSFLILGTRYSALECAFVLLLIGAAISGVFLAGASNKGGNSSFWAAFAGITTSFAAVSFVMKEMAFRQYSQYRSGSDRVEAASLEIGAAPANSSSEELLPADAHADAGERRGHPELPVHLSVFLVGLIVSIGSLITCVPVALLNRWATEGDNAWVALSEGLSLLFTKKDVLTTYFIYTINNFIFNLCLLALTGRGSALLAFLSLKLVVPLTAVCSSIDWKFIGTEKVNKWQWLILVIMLSALGGFRYGNLARERVISKGHKHGCCYPVFEKTSVSSRE